MPGFIGTSNVLAGRRYGIPVYGTMAHSYVMAHEQEREAFEHFVAMFPQLSTLLVDTYDPSRGIDNAVQVARGLRNRGGKLQAIRIDSGDLAELAARARRCSIRTRFRKCRFSPAATSTRYKIQALLRGGSADRRVWRRHRNERPAPMRLRSISPTSWLNITASRGSRLPLAKSPCPDASRSFAP